MTSAPVMIGVDATAGSLEALAWALAECRTRDADLVLVHALDSADAELAETSADARPHTAEEVGRAVLAVHGTAAGQVAPDVVVRSRVLEHPTADALIDASRGASLLVLGSRGTAAFTESALGSVAHRVAVHAHCPVAVVPRNTIAPRWLQLRRIVVGVADTRAGRQAVEFAAGQAQRCAASVVLVRTGESRDAALAELQALRADLVVRFPDVHVEVVAGDGDPIDTLVEQGARADLVVLGCHHSDEPWNARLGGVPTGVLARAHCPVVLVGQLRGGTGSSANGR